MAIYRDDPTEKEFSVISNKVLTDTRLSLRARGLFACLWAQPDETPSAVLKIMDAVGSGRDQMYSALSELEHLGYLRRERTKAKGRGMWNSVDWFLSGTPKE